MTLNLHIPTRGESLRPSITVIGVGGAGGNAVNNMIRANLEGVHFVVANTDAQALDYALTEKRIQLGTNITQGLGAGASPDIGRQAAEEAFSEIEEAIRGSNMVFITAGMGGGTGTGAAPVVASLAKELGILTVGVVTKPFHFEGTHRMRMAEQGLEELQKYVDTLIVIPNQNLFRMANERTTFADAFAMADDVLHSGVRGVTDLMVKHGLINLDFADIRAVMSEMGKAMMGTGEAGGDRRAIEAAEAAISNPLLDDVSMKGARGVLINITGGPDLTLFEVDEAANRIREEVDPQANIIFGAVFDEKMQGTMRVSVVATGVETESDRQAAPKQDSASKTAGAPPLVRPTSPAFKPVNPAPVAQAPVAAPLEPLPTQEAAADDTFSFPATNKAKPQGISEKLESPVAVQKPAPTSFVPPRPVEPAVRPAESTIAIRRPSEPRTAPAAHAEEAAMDHGSAEPAHGDGFFARVGRAFAAAKAEKKHEAAPEAAAPARQQTVMKEATNNPHKAEATKDEYLDIPAFLRRQAN